VGHVDDNSEDPNYRLKTLTAN